MSSNIHFKRLAQISNRRGNSQTLLTDTELDWLDSAVRQSLRQSTKPGGSYAIEVKGTGTAVPVPLLQACTNPGYIQIRCVHGNSTHQPVRCRACTGCHHNWRAKVRAMIISGSELYKTWMLTLTIPEYPEEMHEDRFDFAQSRWHDFLRRAHKIAFTFRYFRVVELQKRDTPHFHLAVNRFRTFSVHSTNNFRTILQHLAYKSGFGHQQGKTFDFQKARLGAKGVASYMSKYLGKSNEWSELRREDGRAIRRYNRSRLWSTPKDPPSFRWAAVPHGFTSVYHPQQSFSCGCQDGLIIHKPTQVQNWLDTNRAEGSWVAPLAVFDWIAQKGL